MGEDIMCRKEHAMRKIDKAYLEITNVCNLQCSFCHGTKRAGHLLTEAEFEALTDRLAGHVKYLYFHLMGEPLLHPLFLHFVRRAWEKGFYPILTTNGSLLAARGEELLAHLPYKISISLHAPAANAAFAHPDYFESCIVFAKRAAEKGIRMDVLCEINIGREAEKGGVMPERAMEFCKQLAEFPCLRLRGIMTMAPKLQNENDYLPYFEETKRIYDSIKKEAIPNTLFDTLSMGMSESYAEGVECGANLVRVGSAIFGKRVYPEKT